MRLFLLAFSFMLFGVWLNIVFNNYVQIGGLKINWILMFLLILTFRHSKLVIPFVGILAGLMLPAVTIVRNKALNTEIGVEISNMEKSIEAYKLASSS